VTSSVIRLDTIAGVAPEPELFAFVRTSFAHRRKTLARNLALAGYERDQVVAAIEGVGLDRRIRAERLDLATFRSLYTVLRSTLPSG
jgi:16S rRNA (adenine1518-N6/adenine1519-N6)-dimethyltransferase